MGVEIEKVQRLNPLISTLKVLYTILILNCANPFKSSNKKREDHGFFKLQIDRKLENQNPKKPNLPARPGDGTDEFGDWTVLFEGGLGWP